MSSKLYSLYKSEKGKELKDSFIEDSLDIMLKQEPELKQYVRNLVITEEPSNLYGSYSLVDLDIKVYKKNIPDINRNQLLILQILRHELEHARNLKTFWEGNKDLETTVIDCSLRDYAQIKGIHRFPQLSPFDLLSFKYHKTENYDSDPDERLANIRSWKYLVNLFKNLRTAKDPKDLYVARLMLYEAYRRGYKDNRYSLEPPTYEFLIQTRLFDDFYWLKKRVESKDYSLDTRLLYGLPITQKEYDTCIKQKTKVPKIKR